MRGRAEGLAQDRSDLPVRRSRHDAVARIARPSLARGVAARRVRRRDASRPAAAAPLAGAATARCTSAPIPDTFWIIDEATEKIVGDDPAARPASRAALTLSRDRTRFYVARGRASRRSRSSTSPSRTTLDTFTLSEGNKKVRIRSIQPDPLDRFLILLTTTADQADRSLGDRRRRRWCSTTWRSTRSRAPFRGRTAKSARTSTSSSRPTASCCTCSATDVLIYETDELHEVDTWELSSRSRRASAGSSFGSSRRRQRRARLLHRPLHDRRIRSRTAASWASAASTWPRRPSTSTPLGPAEPSASRWRRTASAATA